MKADKFVVQIVLASFFYVVMEWLFFITKPSMLGSLELIFQVSVLFVSFLTLVVVSLIFYWFVAWPSSLFMAWIGCERASIYIRCAVASLLFSGALFLLVDNFTYTLAGVASFSYTGWMRFLYIPLYIVLIVYSFRFFYRWFAPETKKASRSLKVVAGSLIIVSCFFSIISIGSVVSLSQVSEEKDVSLSSFKPMNVLFLFADGIDSKRMSLYGSEKKTTPFLSSIKDELLVFENHFTNSGKTTGSVASLLSGKYPASTRVIYRPDVFTGVDAYEHMPGILKKYGYSTADFSVRHYVDPVDLNLLGGFDFANGRDVRDRNAWLTMLVNRYLSDSFLFSKQMYNRISGRVLHMFNIRTMYNPYMVVTKPSAYEYKSLDRKRIDGLKNFIHSSDKPFFAHVHLLGSHGPHFYSEEPFFSEGGQKKPWSESHYDDSILQYDRYIQEVVDLLKREGIYQNTLLVINSDHGLRWGVSSPIPLAFRFPDKEHLGVRKYNTQRIDIAPTVLQVLGIPIPTWMEGVSLLSVDNRGQVKPIYVVNRAPSSDVNGWRQIASPKPPFYTLGILSAVYCNKIFHLDINQKFNLGVEEIKGHTGNCHAKDIPAPDIIYKRLLEHLSVRGYDTTSLSVKAN